MRREEFLKIKGSACDTDCDIENYFPDEFGDLRSKAFGIFLSGYWFDVAAGCFASRSRSGRWTGKKIMDDFGSRGPWVDGGKCRN